MPARPRRRRADRAAPESRSATSAATPRAAPTAASRTSCSRAPAPEVVAANLGRRALALDDAAQALTFATRAPRHARPRERARRRSASGPSSRRAGGPCGASRGSRPGAACVRALALADRERSCHGPREPRAAPPVDLSARARGPVRRPPVALRARRLRLPRRGRGRRPRRHLHDLPDRPRLLPVRLPRLLRGRAPRRQGAHAGGDGARPRLRVRHARPPPHRGQHPARQRPLHRAGPRRRVPPGGLLAALPPDRRPLARPRALRITADERRQNSPS